MPYSSQTVTSDGSLGTVDIIFEYIDRTEIHVYFDSVEQFTGWTWVGTEKRIQFSPVVPNGTVVLIRRATDLSKLRHEYSAGAAFRADTLDESLEQVLHIAQEATEAQLGGEFFADINMHNNSIVNLKNPETDPTAAVSLKQYQADALGAHSAKSIAENAAGDAMNSASAALTSRNQAEGFKDTASTAAGTATTAKNQAVDAKTDAETARNKAQEWAEKSTAVELEQFSAKYWATDAAASAVLAGDNGRLSIGTVSTGAAGSSASASITGVVGSQSLNLTIPRGDTGVGDVTGPASATSDAVALFDGTTGKLLKNSGTVLTTSRTDTTTGRVMKSGDYGIGGVSTTALPVGTDLDAAGTIPNGFFTVKDALNKPPGTGSWGYLHVQHQADYQVLQTFTEFITATEYKRQSDGTGVFGAWVRTLNHSDVVSNTSGGTVDKLITVGNAAIVFDSVADMVAATWLTVGQKVRTLGYYTRGDGGGNYYEIVAASTGVDDGGSHIDLSGSGLQARGLFASETVSSQQWGTSKKVFYVSTYGRQGANGGIDDPFDSLQSCYDYISSLGQWFVGSFEIRLGSGTYSTPGGRVVNNARFETQLVIKGAAVGGHPNVPTTVITLPGGNHGFSPGFKNWLKIEDIKCTGNTANGEAFSVGNGSVLSLVNCHTQGVRLPVTYQHGAQLDIAGGIYDGENIPDSYGVRGYYGSSHSIDAPDIPSGAIFKNFTYGLYINEGCFGHLDHTTVTDCDVGVIFSRVDSGSNTKGMRIHRCGIGVQAYCSSWMDNGIDFGIGTADECTVPVDSRASAEFYERASRNISRTPRYQSSGMWGLSQTNTVDDVTIWTPGEIRPGYARATGDVITIKLIVVPNAANSGNSVVSFRINGVYAGGVQVGPTDGRGVVEAHMLFGTSTEIRSLVTFTSPNANRLDYKTLAVPDSGDITVHLSNASLADTFSINFGTYETTLGG